jgi:hypothetical protein
MRIVAAFLAVGLLAPIRADASSIITLPDDDDYPSIIAPHASFSFPSVAFVMPTEPIAISSVITMGEPALKETVSASNGKSSVIHRFDSPMVIRGGIIGDAFVRAAPAVAAPTATPADTAGAPAPQPEPDATTTSSYGQPATEQPATE